jgi:hypothetical protein
MSSAPRIHMCPTSATPEREISALAAIYRRAIERFEQATAAGMTSTNGDDAMKGPKHDRASTNCK